jgi:hypothetical protein
MNVLLQILQWSVDRPVYRPFGLDLFPKLVDACEQVRARLQSQITALGPARTLRRS